MQTPSDAASADHEVIIIGAGPVGLVLGCLLGQRGLRVLILERRLRLPDHSQAIGITPPTLKVLSQLGLADSFIERGVRIHDCQVHGQTGYLGCASFREIPSPYPFVLSLPQQLSMGLLAGQLATYPTIELRMGVEVTALRQDKEAVTLEVKDAEGRTFTTHAPYVVACDGCHSRMRDLVQIRHRTHHYGCHFVMGDFVDHSPFGQEAHLFFTATGAVESFPLPDGRRRWIVQTDERRPDPPSGFISQIVRERAGVDLAPSDQLNQSAFSPWRLDCDRLHAGRVILCGDAAHVMSPIGGQGMNSGIADAEFVAAMLYAILHGGQSQALWFSEYDCCRRIAANTAATRAERGMGLGTWRGQAASLLRDFILRFCLFRGPLAQHVGRWFSMVSLPYNSLDKSAWAMEQLERLRLSREIPPNQ